MRLFRREHLFLFFIVSFGFILRTVGLNWDQNFHLHPDERFLTMVGNAMTLPSSLIEYLNPRTSPMNPYNLGYDFYVYGTFPLIINKIIAVLLGNDTYNAFTLQGRLLSALFDTFTVIFVYRIGMIVFNNVQKALWGAFFYAVAVLAIQLSHFFTTDTFTNTFLIISIYYSARVFMMHSSASNGIGEKIKHCFQKTSFPWREIVISGVFFGLALASKVSALYTLPLVCVFLAIPFLLKFNLKHLMVSVILFAASTYLSLRLANPYYFESASFFDISLHEKFRSSMDQLHALNNPEAWFPPGVQWINKPPILFSIYNLTLYGFGIVATFFSLLGMGRVIVNYFQLIKQNRRKKVADFFREILLPHEVEKRGIIVLFILLGWCVCFFIYQSIQFTQNMRYFIYIYPILSLLGGLGTYTLLKKLSAIFFCGLTSRRRTYVTISSLLILIFVLIWPLMFVSIYTRPHSRVVASEWMYRNLPNNSIIAYEHWDDPLPLAVTPYQTKQFQLKELPVFAQDSYQKLGDIYSTLDSSDYYVLSSNRAWGSISSVPERYPLMSKFYDNLLNDRFEYRRVAEFSSYPQLCLPLTQICWQVKDQGFWVDEAFTVYDHPTVLIFKNER